MRDGTKIRICDMSDAHLLNTMKMLQRIAERKYQEELAGAFIFAGQCRGDMASYMADQACDAVAEKDWRYYVHELYWNMQEEAERRGLLNNAGP